jgi:hypothetical protein
MSQFQVSKLKHATSHMLAAMVVVFAAGAFLYANHATVASYVAAQPASWENALHEVPAASGLNNSAALLW